MKHKQSQDQLPKQLQELKAKNEAMKLPDDYFSEMEQELMNKIQQQDSKTHTLGAGFWTYAAATVALFMVAFFGWKELSVQPVDSNSAFDEFMFSNGESFEDISAEDFYEDMSQLEWDELEVIY